MAFEANKKGTKNELLRVAVVKGELTTVRRLLERSSVDINTKNSVGLSCLQLAILRKHFKLAEYLVQKGIDIHSRDLKGWTALHDAVLVDSKVLVRKLVGKGCNLTLTTHSSELPIDLAVSVKMEKLLCEEMTSQGEQRLAREYFVYLGLEYLRDSYCREPPPLASRQPKPSVDESHQPVATGRSQILGCENRTSRSCPSPTTRYHTSDLETGNHGSLKCTNYKTTSPSNNHCRTKSRLEEALINPPTYESTVKFRQPINSLPQLRTQSCRSQLQQAASKVLDNSSHRDVSCFDVRTTPTAVPRRKVSFAIADSIMAGTTVKTVGSQSVEKQSRSSSGGSEASDVVNPLRLPSNVIAQLNQIYEHRKNENSSDSDEPVDRDDAIALLKMKPRRSSIASPERRKSFVNGRRRSVTFQPEVLLQEMVTDGDAKAVSAVLRSGAIPDVNKMSPAGLTALHQSAIDGNLACAKTLVSNGANVNCADCEKWTPLHAAAMSGHADLVQFLLEAGANPKMKNQDDETAYDIAKHGPIRKILLCAMNGKSPDADEFSDGEYSGEEEEEYSHAESDSDDDLDDENRVEPELFHSTAETNPESLKERLGLNHNVPPKTDSPSPDFDTQDSVFTSTEDKNYKVCLPIPRRERNFSDSMSSCGSLYEPELERIQKLTSEQKEAGTHCLRTTEDFCHNDMDKISISEDQGIGTMDGSSDSSNRRGTLSEDEGTSCDVLDSELEQSSLDYKFQEACLYCDVDAILKLVKHRSQIDVNRVNKSSGITALHHAVLEENFAMVQHLIKDFEASVLVKDTDGWTPLHAASAVGNIRIAQFLLENGAKASALNNNCEFPVDVAGDETMEKLLESAMLGPSVGKIFKGIFTRR